MCRNIKTLHNFEPPATEDEIQAAALQYVRKVSGITKPSGVTVERFELAVAQIASATADLLADLPERRNPPPTLPPMRRHSHA